MIMKLSPEIKRSLGFCGLKAEDSLGHFSLEEHKILSSWSPQGVVMQAWERDMGVDILVRIKKGVRLKKELFFCFGVKRKKGQQIVRPKIILEKDSEATIVSHCGFPLAEKVLHQMEGKFLLEEGAKLNYREYHYHGEKSGAEVLPKLKVELKEGSAFLSDFSLTQGSVGKVRIELEVLVGTKAKAEIITKAMGQGSKDEVIIVDKVYLAEKEARSLIKMRAAAKNGGQVLMQGETYAFKSGCRGHIDCQEILIGQKSVARAVPIVEVSHPEARITHEASVGKINQKELETLMTRGLTENQAAMLIVDSIMQNT